ncbi:hypothetical protein KQI63_15740 [bacterium]|nr:hypothetical protein [bacterium]
MNEVFSFGMKMPEDSEFFTVEFRPGEDGCEITCGCEAFESDGNCVHVESIRNGLNAMSAADMVDSFGQQYTSRWVQLQYKRLGEAVKGE